MTRVAFRHLALFAEVVFQPHSHPRAEVTEEGHLCSLLTAVAATAETCLESHNKYLLSE